VTFGRGQHLQPVAQEFLQAYPEVDLRLLLLDRVVPLVEEHVAVAGGKDLTHHWRVALNFERVLLRSAG